jgi:RNA polymerase sigma factor (sigma-70 family)
MTWTLPIDWDQIYVEHAPRVYNYFRFRVGNRADVEDLTSRTFENAWRSRTRYRHDLAAISTWLFKIAQNVAVDHLRARRDHVPIDEAFHFATDNTPENDAARGSNLARLTALTKDLPDRDRDLLARNRPTHPQRRRHRPGENRRRHLTTTSQDLLEEYPVCFVEVSKHQYHDYVGYARWYYHGQPFPLTQIIWPNKDGYYPWSPRAPETFKRRQPVLGEAPAGI